MKQPETKKYPAMEGQFYIEALYQFHRRKNTMQDDPSIEIK